MPDAALTTRTIIGLEVHVQLATRTKLFCGCAVRFGDPPNTLVCPVCLGLPGVLPVLNRQAVDFAVRTGLALGCQIATFTKWDRKSYYYPDLPKNYQISQYDLPVCHDGALEVECQGHSSRVRIRRAHLEEDAGKNIHDTPGCTLVDLNRTGTPLLEIVTEPDLTSAEQAYEFAVELQRLVTYLGVSEGSMQKGQMRFEPNVNVAIVRDGVEYRTPISEIKNLNSFRAVRNAIDYEARRQLQDWMADNGYVQKQRPNENRGWVEERGATEIQRTKEEAHDYRYFPDPDLVPLRLDPAELEEVRAAMPELPRQRRARFVAEFGLSAPDAGTIVSDRDTADLLDAAVAAGGPPEVLAKQFVNIWAKLANARGGSIAALNVAADRMGELAALVADGTISPTAANQIAERLIESDHPPRALAEELGLIRVVDVDRTARWVDEAMAANESAVQSILTNPKKAKASEGFLRGQVMRVSGGKADPRLAGELIAKRIAELRAGSSDS